MSAIVHRTNRERERGQIIVIFALALVAIIQPVPWYRPQYAIPLLGMLLGNTMSGVALALERLTQGTWQQRTIIEGRLLLGQGWREAIGEVRREAMRSGMIPTISGMATAGLVSLPGMMTGHATRDASRRSGRL